MTKNQKIVLFVLCLSMLFSMISVFATENPSLIEHSEGVFTNKHSSYTVIIPKSFPIDNNKSAYRYLITVKGDLAGTETISISLRQPLVLNSSNKDKQIIVKDDITIWTCQNLNNEMIKTLELTENVNGKYNGYLYFEINKN